MNIYEIDIEVFGQSSYSSYRYTENLMYLESELCVGEVSKKLGEIFNEVDNNTSNFYFDSRTSRKVDHDLFNLGFRYTCESDVSDCNYFIYDVDILLITKNPSILISLKSRNPEFVPIIRRNPKYFIDIEKTNPGLCSVVYQ